MSKKENTAIEEFSPEQIKKFDAMHKTLRDYNVNTAKGNSPLAPAFTDEEMHEYSTYRQMLLSKQCDA